MTVFRERGTWRADVYLFSRKVASKSGFERRRDAEDWHDRTRLEFRAAPAEAAESRQMAAVTFADVLSDFESRHLPTVRFSTRVRYQVDLAERIKPFFGAMPMASVTPGVVERFKSECMATLAPKSVNNCLHLLRLIFNCAVIWQRIDKNPYAAKSLALPERPYPWWPEAEEIRRFLEAARASRYYAVYLTALETGMRYGELIGLAKADIDFSRGTIHVHRQWLEREHRYGPVKHSRPRHIPFSPSGELGITLRKTVLASAHPEAVFTTATGERPTKGGLAHKYLKAVERRAKVTPICFHGLRHTFASWYMMRVGNVWDLMALLGHSNIQTTMRYAHHAQNARRQPLDLAAVFTRNSPATTDSIALTTGNRLEKGWRDGRDLNPSSLFSEGTENIG